TPDGTKYLRGDSTWATVSSGVATRTWAKDPADHNLKSMVDTPGLFQNTAPLLAASTLYLMRVWLQAGIAVTNYLTHCQTLATSPAANLYSFALFRTDATGTLVAGSGSADASSVWLTTG